MENYTEVEMIGIEDMHYREVCFARWLESTVFLAQVNISLRQHYSDINVIIEFHSRS